MGVRTDAVHYLGVFLCEIQSIQFSADQFHNGFALYYVRPVLVEDFLLYLWYGTALFIFIVSTLNMLCAG